ncbi:hypothetical protein K402DRAFT_424971 [Aulographum hederae CBS 113979]|uniref:Uncharacterized protein n=1 Tax=Aulographum hederae CBS 113979 TaxID=1176131 RepID=A0A6G1GM16_9PEZI|nr:hypothetical protein K402DRAFT_424971 [Aulographum hederae CBS 113979]
MTEDFHSERPCSYGRGGAGNLRRPSETAQYFSGAADPGAEEGQHPRRSSAWANKSSGTGANIWKSAKGMFVRRGSTAEDLDEDVESKE